MNHRCRRECKNLVRMCLRPETYVRMLGVIILAILLYKINVLKIVPVLKNADKYLLGISILLVFPLMLLKASRWDSLLRMQNIHYSLKDAVLVYLASYYVGLVTPGRVGDFIKVWYLRKEEAVPYGKAFVSVLLDRLFDLMLIGIVGILGIYYFGLLGRLSYLSLGFLTLIVVVFVTLFNDKILTRLLKSVDRILLRKYHDKLQFHANDFAADMNKLKNIKLLLPVSLTVLAYGITFFQCYLIALALHIDLSFFYIAFAVSIAGVVALVPISFSGIGTRDAALVFLFGLSGIVSQRALSFSLLYLATFILTIGAWGGVCWLKRPFKMRE